MSPVLKPIADLCRGQARGLGQLSLLGRVGVGILEVPLSEQVPGPLLEAVGLLLPVPDGSRQRVLLPNSVLVHWAQRPSPQFFGLLIVGLEPHGLQFCVGLLCELMMLQDVVQIPEVARVERD